MGKKIAVIGSGISGLTCAYLLADQHQVSLYESSPTLGGHTATVDVDIAGQSYAVDTGFIVFNDRTYPNFLHLLDRIGVAKQKAQMSFSVSHAQSGLEYNGHSLTTLFAQRSNLFNPRFYRFLREIIRFNALAKKSLRTDFSSPSTLGGFLNQHGFTGFFAQHYILPMVAAIWSGSMQEARDFPLILFLRFFHNHGLLDIVDRPQWYVIKGGSRQYIPGFTANLQHIYLNTAVQAIERQSQQVSVHSTRGIDQFDEVILACHSDQALTLLADATDEEQRVLGALPYCENQVVLHTDTCLLPCARGAWASWNYRFDGDTGARAAVTYNMNLLQGLDCPQTLCVTLNQSERISPEKILLRFTYAHPVINNGSYKAQSQRHQICGRNHTHFCGAYWYNGFHEDGVNSALDVCRRLGVRF